MKKLIQLDPLSPPLHPMLSMFKKKVQKIKSATLSVEELEIFRKHLCSYIGIQNYNLLDLGPANNVLSRHISSDTILLNTERKNFAASAENKIEYFVQAVNPSTGILYTDNLPDKTSLIDVTGLMPYTDTCRMGPKYMMLRLDQKLGVDLNWVVLLKKKLNETPSFSPEATAGVRLMNYLFEDYSLQKELVIRDYKYKAALIENLISSHSQLNYYIKNPKSRSKSVFSFQTESMSAADFKTILEKKGFETGLNTDDKGTAFLLAANFINHSKEQVEAFVDTVNESI